MSNSGDGRRVIGRQEVNRLVDDHLFIQVGGHFATAMHQQLRIPSLDGVRALAIIGIIAFHLASQTLPGGFIGIVIFFVLSGFLTTRGVIHRYLTDTFSYRSYLLDRLIRIVPEMAGVILICSSLTPLVGGDSGVGLGRQVLAAFTFSSNWVLLATGNEYFDQDSPALLRNLWFLGPEMQLSLLWPILLVVLLRVLSRITLPTHVEHTQHDTMRIVVLATAAITAGLACASGVLMAVFVSMYDIDRVYYGTDTQSFGFFLGASLALLLDNITRKPLTKTRHVALSISAQRAIWQLIAALGLLSLGAAMFVFQGTDRATYQGPLQAIALITAIVIAALVMSRGPVSSFMSCWPLLYIASHTYALYLWHWPIMVLAMNYMPRVSRTSPWFIFAVIALSLVAAELSHQVIARPVTLLRAETATTSQAAVEHNGASASQSTVTQSDHAEVAQESIDAHHQGAISGPTRVRKIIVMTVGTVCCIALITTTVMAIAVAPSETIAQQRVDEGRAAIDRDSIEKAQPPQPNEPTATPTQTPTPEPVAITGDQIVGVGDSVMLGSADALIARLPGIDIDAKVSRQPWDVPNILTDMANSGRLRDVVLIGIGTNGTLTPDILAQIRAIIGPDRLLVLVNAYAERSWISTTNQSIQDFVANDPNAVMVDWFNAISAHKEYLSPDRVHPEAEGSALYADLIDNALTEAAKMQ